MRRTIPAAAAMTLVAVTLTACAGESTQPISSVDEIPAAIQSIDDESAAWEMALDVDFDLDEIMEIDQALARFDDASSSDDPFEDLDAARTFVDVGNRLTLSGATDDDGDTVMAFNIAGEPAVEFAAGGEFVEGYMTMSADPLGFLDADPLPLEFYLRVDGDRLGAFVAEMDDSTSQSDVDEFLGELRANPAATISQDPTASFDDLAAGIEQFPADVREEAGLPDTQALVADIEALVDAAVNGGWFGLSGELDYAGIFESMGMTREQLEKDLEGSGMDFPGEPFDPEAFTQVFVDAVTFRDLTPGEGGAATATMDVDVEALALGYVDALEAYDTFGTTDQMRDEIAAEDLPTLSGVGTITLVGDNVTEFRVDLVQIGLAIAESDPTIGTDEVDAVREVVEGFETTRAAFVMRYFDHGAVDDLVDGIDAATLDASLIAAAAAMSMAMNPMGMDGMNGMDGMDGMGSVDGLDGSLEVETGTAAPALPDPEGPTGSTDSGGAAMDEVLSEVRNAAVEIETYYTENGTYPTSMEDVRLGASASNGVLLNIARSDETSFCVQGLSSQTSDQAFYDSASGQTGPGPCPDPAAGTDA